MLFRTFFAAQGCWRSSLCISVLLAFGSGERTVDFWRDTAVGDEHERPL